MVNQQMLTATIDEIEAYVRQIRVDSKLAQRDAGIKGRFVRWVLSLKGMLLLQVLFVLLNAALISAYFFVQESATPETVADWAALIAISFYMGMVVTTLTMAIAMSVDIFSGGALLRHGFAYLKWDCSKLMDLENYLIKRPRNELIWVKMLLEQSPPHTMFAEPLKNTLKGVFSISVASGIALGLLKLKAGGNSSLFEKIEIMASEHFLPVLLGFEVVLGVLLLIVFYYQSTSQLYGQKTKRVLALLENLIASKNSVKPPKI